MGVEDYHDMDQLYDAEYADQYADQDFDPHKRRERMTEAAAQTPMMTMKDINNLNIPDGWPVNMVARVKKIIKNEMKTGQYGEYRAMMAVLQDDYGETILDVLDPPDWVQVGHVVGIRSDAKYKATRERYDKGDGSGPKSKIKAKGRHLYNPEQAPGQPLQPGLPLVPQAQQQQSTAQQSSGPQPERVIAHEQTYANVSGPRQFSEAAAVMSQFFDAACGVISTAPGGSAEAKLAAAQALTSTLFIAWAKHDFVMNYEAKPAGHRTEESVPSPTNSPWEDGLPKDGAPAHEDDDLPF